MRLFVGFMVYKMPAQPDFIVRAFGKKGQKMKGELVRESKTLGVKRAEIVETFSWGESAVD